MNKTARTLACFAALALLLATPGPAKAEGVDLGRLNFGQHVTGPEVTERELQDRFVLVEYWGINCGPCIASIPHITDLAEDYGHRKLIVVALHRQGGTVEEVKEVWEGRARSNHVAVFNGGHLPGFGNGSIPLAILFDPSGREVWQGRPSQVDKPLKDAMRRYRPPAPEPEEEAGPDPIVTGVEARYFAREIEQINEQSRSLAMPLARLRNAIERSGREEQVAEATAVLAQVTGWVESKTAEAQQHRANDPATAYAIADELGDLLGRDDLGGPLLELKREMQSDEQVMDTVRSTRMLREVIASAESIGLTEDPTAAAADRSNSRTLRTVTRDLRRIASAWPETDAGKRAAVLLSEWGLQD